MQNNNDLIRFKSIFFINMLSQQQTHHLQNKHKATAQWIGKTITERDDDDDDDVTQDSPWQVDGIHSADERPILNRLFQEEFTSMWTNTDASEQGPVNVAIYIRAP